MARHYPYIVVRFMATVYQREDISIHCGEPKAHVGYRDSFVHHPNPFAEDGALNPECEALLISATHEAIRRTHFRMCLVWGPKRCTFLERDGSEVDSDDPPSGGIGSGGIGGTPLPIEIDLDTGKSAAH